VNKLGFLIERHSKLKSEIKNNPKCCLVVNRIFQPSSQSGEVPVLELINAYKSLR
jgi:hypothetical protein